jgi:hypothetical protein
LKTEGAQIQKAAGVRDIKSYLSHIVWASAGHGTVDLGLTSRDHITGLISGQVVAQSGQQKILSSTQDTFHAFTLVEKKFHTLMAMP